MGYFQKSPRCCMTTCLHDFTAVQHWGFAVLQPWCIPFEKKKSDGIGLLPPLTQTPGCSPAQGQLGTSGPTSEGGAFIGEKTIQVIFSSLLLLSN